MVRLVLIDLIRIRVGFLPHSRHGAAATVLALTIQSMAEHKLSVEQRFRLEAACRKLDGCDDIDAIRDLAKQLLHSLEMERASARQAIADLKQKDGQAPSLARRFGFNIHQM